ncbi:MAG: DUF488 family protein, partial [Thaumarchaeota archaeon]|nr:DUF488 family protein [Nitrososphaerota archaeon]
MAVKTKSIYAPAGPSDGRRILVTRYHPRGVKRSKYDAWDRSLAPRAKLLKAYKDKDLEWADFERRPLQELRASPDSVSSIRELHACSRTHDITLLCYEPAGRPCHRRLLKKIIGDPALLGDPGGGQAA